MSAGSVVQPTDATRDVILEASILCFAMHSYEETGRKRDDTSSPGAAHPAP